MPARVPARRLLLAAALLLPGPRARAQGIDGSATRKPGSEGGPLVGGGVARVGAVTAERLAAADVDSANWLTYGRDQANRRWSPLRQLDTASVARLHVAWVQQLGGPEASSLETSPLAVDGVLFVTNPVGAVLALDAKTGGTLWRYDPKLGPYSHCCSPANRGVAVADSTVYLATLDARLVALDARTGRGRWEAMVADPDSGYSATMAPLVVGDLVVVGPAGGEYGIRGVLRAFDRRTGRPRWTWFATAERGWEGRFTATTGEGDSLHRDLAAERAAAAAHRDAWRRGGGAVWMTPAYDAASGRIILTTGNPSPDLDGAVRPGDNLYTNSIVALDAATGRMAWYYQQVPHDVWDLDPSSPPAIVALRDGRRAVVEAGKTGWVYVLDAATGALVRRSEAFVPQQHMFSPPTRAGVRIRPGSNGGSEWSPVSFDPTRGLLFVQGIDEPEEFVADGTPQPAGGMWLGGALHTVPAETSRGNLTAIDVNTGRIAWQRPSARPMLGGTLATAGGLVFTGEGDGTFSAHRASDGATLWSFFAGAGCSAPPITYLVDGAQYVTVACGGNRLLRQPHGEALVTFRLDPAP